MQFYIYILWSKTSEKYYVGFSEDVIRRLDQHNNARRTKYTSKHLPWILAGYFAISNDRGAAMRAEKIIKKRKSRQYIERLLTSALEQFKLAQLVRVPTAGRD